MGGTVFLEFAIVHVAEGNTNQTYSLYATLTKNHSKDIKTNAVKLLYGLEAMNFIPAHLVWTHGEL